MKKDNVSSPIDAEEFHMTVGDILHVGDAAYILSAISLPSDMKVKMGCQELFTLVNTKTGRSLDLAVSTFEASVDLRHLIRNSVIKFDGFAKSILYGLTTPTRTYSMRFPDFGQFDESIKLTAFRGERGHNDEA